MGENWKRIALPFSGDGISKNKSKGKNNSYFFVPDASFTRCIYQEKLVWEINQIGTFCIKFPTSDIKKSRGTGKHMEFSYFVCKYNVP